MHSVPIDQGILHNLWLFYQRKKVGKSQKEEETPK